MTTAAGEAGEAAVRGTFNSDLAGSTEMDLKGNSTQILLLEETETKTNDGIFQNFLPH